MTAAPPDVVVMGGGIAGLATALALADRGARVTVLDVRRAGAASRASAGLLAPSLGFTPEVSRHAFAARDAYPAWVAGLVDATGVPVSLNRRGIIELADDDADVARLHAAAGHDAERLDAAAVAELEPALAGHRGALLHPLDGAVDNVALMDALVRRVESHRRITARPVAVASIAMDATGGAAIGTDGTRHAGAHLVVATGAWMGGLGGLPRALPVRPVRGELLVVAHEGLRHVTHGAGGYLVPRRDGVLVGATSEDAGFDPSTSDAGAAALRDIARRASPALALAPTVSHWAGLRPMSPDGLPILGPDPVVPGLWYAGGLSRNGILFAPWAAERIAAMIAGDPVEEPGLFGVERFGRGAGDVRPT